MKAILNALRLYAGLAGVWLLVPYGFLVENAPPLAAAWSRRWFGVDLYASTWPPDWGALATGLLGWFMAANGLAALGYWLWRLMLGLERRLGLRTRLAATFHMPAREGAAGAETEARA